tara:strand:- start:180 stop:404 length:225 start_codon:yes stop_codon:yes gene_type:complete
MEIPTNTYGDIHYAELIIEKQALEIRELQAVIVRLKDEMRNEMREDDGQPTEYEEYQDLYGGDDWDHGQYEEVL